MPPLPQSAPEQSGVSEQQDMPSLEPQLNEEMPQLRKTMMDREMPSPAPEPVVPVKPAVRGIEVVALRDGMYKKYRRKAGGKSFIVDKFEELGSWMKCVDPAIEKKHQAVLKARHAHRKVIGQQPNAGE
jgi:hypothetical protein